METRLTLIAMMQHSIGWCKTELGWFSLLCGYLHTDLVSAQTCYYQQINSRKSGFKWASMLMTKLWHMVHSIWCHRCNHLDNSQAIHDLKGLLELLRTAMTHAHENPRGHGTLPMVYRPYFYTMLNTILSQSVTSLKNWFLVVRSGRECNYQNNTEDAIFTNTTLRAWVGLTPLE